MRRILFAPPAAGGLVRGAPGAAAAAASARVSALFANGTFGVWELDANMELRQARPRASLRAIQRRCRAAKQLRLPGRTGSPSTLV